MLMLLNSVSQTTFCKPLDWSLRRIRTWCLRWASVLNLNSQVNDAASYEYVVSCCVLKEAIELARFMASINAWADRPVYAGKLESIALETMLYAFSLGLIDLEEVKSK